MSPFTYIIATLLCTNITLAVIFFIAWRTMGRPKHALIWAIAFVLGILQWVGNILRDAFPSPDVRWIVLCALSVGTVVLATWGHVERTKAKIDPRLLFAIGALVTAVTAFFTVVMPHTGLKMSIYVYHNAVFLLVSGIIVWRYREKPLPAEIGATVTYFISAAIQFAAATAALMQGAITDQGLQDLYSAINFIALPSSFTAMGLFVVFILASDLADNMRQLAVTDMLTGCLNRRGFFEKAAARIAALKPQEEHACLIYFDIDRFKEINDCFGHAGGDRVLVQTTNVVRANIKAGDLIGRIGGEEFVILLARATEEEALGVAQRLREKVEGNTIFCDKKAVQVTASFGVARIDAPTISVEKVIHAADVALYTAKNEGRNQVVYAA